MSPLTTRRCTHNQYKYRGLQHTPSPCGQQEFCWYLILPSIPADKGRERAVNSNPCTTHRIRRNKGASPKSSHPACNSRWLPSADHQGCHIPGCWLFIRIQCHIGSPYFEFMESRHLNLPFDDHVSHRVRSGRSKRGSSGGMRMLHCRAGDGWSFIGDVYRRTADSSRTGGGIGRSTTWWF